MREHWVTGIMIELDVEASIKRFQAILHIEEY
jgi:hypothetical protein